METAQDFGPTCKYVFQTRAFHVLVPGLESGTLRVHLAVPIFAPPKVTPSKQDSGSLVGAVLLIADMGKGVQTLIPRE